MNPGGPGSSGVSLIVHHTVDDPSLHAAYDFVSFDPRGVGQSDPVNCGFTDKELDLLNFTEDSPRTAAQRAALVRAYGGIGKLCAAHDLNVMKWVDTASVARDIDVLRAALHQPKVTWLGFSYGTKLGEVYAELFPKNVRRMALDGVVPTNTTYLDEGITHAGTEELGIRDYFATCATDIQEEIPCPFAADPTHGEAKLIALEASLRAHPIKVTTMRGTGFVDDGYLRTELDEYTQARSLYAHFNDEMGPAITKGDWGPVWNSVQSGLGRLPNGTYPDHGVDIAQFLAIKCIDSPTRASVNELAADAAKARKVNPLTGEQAVWSIAQCLNWPVATSELPHTFINHGQPPILLIGSTHDFVTPIAWAVSMQSRSKTRRC